MKTKDKYTIEKEIILLLAPFEDEVLELIENQVRDDENTLDRGDLQGSVEVIIRKAYNAGKQAEGTITIDKKDLKSWLERLDTLQKCNLEPEKCTHDRNEEGEIQPFDYASIDMCLIQIISEIKDYLK